MFGLIPFERRRNELRPSADERPLDIDRIFENFFNDAIFPTFYSQSGMMRVDIKETDKAYILEAEVPGVNKDQISVEVDQDILTITVNQEEEEEVEDEEYLRRERRKYTVTRSFNIEGIDPDHIAAKLENGVLTLELPKKEPGKKRARKVDIS
ncbi:MAG: Hsp20/alpha crystallin family protein [Clostridia bacterium]|nr:Hsp20/alpha crystallin family protein [Clostridia bacterium]